MSVQPHSPRLQRCDGATEVAFGAPGRMTDLAQRVPGRVLFPHIRTTGWDEAVLVNTAGGLTGGDRMNAVVRAEGTARILATTQAAEKIYKSVGGAVEIRNSLSVSDAAALAWLPQEMIVFDGAEIDRRLDIHLVGNAELLAVEMAVLGRAAHGETLTRGTVRDRISVHVDGEHVLEDRFRLEGDVSGHRTSPALLNGNACIGTLLYRGPDPEAVKDLWTDPENGLAAGEVRGLVVGRALTEQADTLRTTVRNALKRVSAERPGWPMDVPRVWLC